MLREGQTPANRRAEEISQLDSFPSVSSRGSLEMSQSFEVQAQHLISLSAAPAAPAHAEMLCIFQENAPISAYHGRCAWRWVLAGGPAAPAPAAPDVFNHSPAVCSFAVSVTPLSFRLLQHLSVGPIPRQKRPRQGAAVLLFLLRPGCHLPLGKDGARPVRGKQISACRPSAPSRPPSCRTAQPPPVHRRQRLLKILGGRRGRAPNTFHYFPSVCLITGFFEVLVLSSVPVRERAQ